MHRCPVNGCTEDVPGHLLMCGAHWRLVLPSLKRALYRAWDRGIGRGSGAHHRAMQQCIEYVNQQIQEEANGRTSPG